MGPEMKKGVLIISHLYLLNNYTPRIIPGDSRRHEFTAIQTGTHTKVPEMKKGVLVISHLFLLNNYTPRIIPGDSTSHEFTDKETRNTLCDQR